MREWQANQFVYDPGENGVEKYTEGFAEFERKLGQQTHVEAVASMLDTHAQLTEEVVKAGVSAARELITA